MNSIKLISLTEFSKRLRYRALNYSEEYNFNKLGKLSDIRYKSMSHYVIHDEDIFDNMDILCCIRNEIVYLYIKEGIIDQKSFNQMGKLVIENFHDYFRNFISDLVFIKDTDINEVYASLYVSNRRYEDISATASFMFRGELINIIANQYYNFHNRSEIKIYNDKKNILSNIKSLNDLPSIDVLRIIYEI